MTRLFSALALASALIQPTFVGSLARVENPTIWKSTLRDTFNVGRFGNRPYALLPGLEFTALACLKICLIRLICCSTPTHAEAVNSELDCFTAFGSHLRGKGNMSHQSITEYFYAVQQNTTFGDSVIDFLPLHPFW